jgi:predicted DNA-binding transcriptional regulator AlpA
MLPQPQQTEGSALAYALPGPVVAPAPAAPSPGAEPALKTREAAGYLGMSQSWLRQSRMAGRTAQPPPYHVIGGRAVRYFRHELDRWLAHRVPGGDQRKLASEIETVPPEPARVSTKARPGRGALAQQRRGEFARPSRSKGARRRSG